MMKKITLLFVLAISTGLFAQSSFGIDYDGLDRVQGAINGTTSESFIWSLNNDPTIQSSFNSNWALVNFNNLVNTDDLNNVIDYPEAGDYTIQLDSIQVLYNFVNNANSNHELILGVYEYSDMPITSTAFPLVTTASEVDPTNGLTPLFAQTIDTSDLVSSTFGSLQSYTFMVNTAIPAGERFSIYLESEGDTLNEFSLLATYQDACGDAELATLAAEPYNSQCYGNFGGALRVPQRFIWGPAEYTCRDFWIQNFVVVPFVTVTSNSFVAEASYTSPNVFPNAACENDLIQINTSYVGNDGSVTIDWSPGAGFSDSTIANPTYTMGQDDVELYVTITDSVGTVVRDTIEILSLYMTVDAGADESVLCNQESNVVAVASIPSISTGAGSVPTTYTWSNGDDGALTTASPGTYTVTATNAGGCMATDDVTINVQGLNNVDFTYETGKICAGQEKTFTNNSSNTTGWDFTWQLNDANDKFGNTATYSIIAAGTYTIKLTGDSAVCSFSKERNITVEDCTADAIDDLDFATELVISPNPTSNDFVVSFELNEVNDVELSLLSIDGKNLQSYALNNTSEVNQVFETAKLSSGLYIIKIMTNEGVTTKNLVITKD